MPPAKRPASERPGGSRVDPRVGTILAERYRLDELLGEGGMGKVYSAEHVLMRKRLAVKILHTELTQVPEVVARFEREAMAAANIEHPNVAAATDFGKLPDGAVFLVLEFVQGRNLRDEIAKGPMSIERALLIARQIGAGLAAAHALDIVHRDLKPENVMLVQKGADPDFVKVLDFGIAKVPMGDKKDGHGKPITKVGMVFGTPEYMSPEQALGQNVDGRADIYALGVILFEMIAGVRPFSSKSPVGILGQQLSKPPPSAAERCPGLFVPPAVEQLLQKLLSREVAERFQSASDAVAAMDNLLGGPPASGQRLFTMAAGTPPSNPMNPRIESIPDLEAPLPVLMPPDAAAPGLSPIPVGPLPPLPVPPGAPPMPSSPGVPPMPSAPEISVRQSVTSAPGTASEPDPLEADLDDVPASVPGVRPLLPPHEAERFRAALDDMKGRGRRVLSSSYAWIDDRRTKLPPKVAERLARVPTPALLFGGLGLIFGGVLAIVIVVGVAFKHHDKTVPGASPSGSASALPAPSGSAPELNAADRASDNDIESAKAGGISQLQLLAGRYPKDGRVFQALLKAELGAKDNAAALGTVEKLLELDPKHASDPEVSTALWLTSQSHETTDKAFELLEGPMGARGADLIYDLSTTSQVRREIRQKADKWLSGDAFEKSASPALKVLIALKRATTCRQHHDLLERAKNDGDERALALLQSYTRKSGCGRRHDDDCYPCMRSDDALSDAIKEISARTKKK
jgi:serine/threonine protein kinase